MVHSESSIKADLDLEEWSASSKVQTDLYDPGINNVWSSDFFGKVQGKLNFYVQLQIEIAHCEL